MRRPSSAMLLALACLLGVLIACPARTATGGPVTGALSRSGKWLTDPEGRVVVVHGFNIVKKIAPFYPIGFTAEDARFLADEGFTGARIGLIWEGVEPSPGHYDARYIRRIADLDSLLAAYGIRTMVDFHQDFWSRSLGFDGAPEWATLNAGQPGVAGMQEAFAAFWRNDDGPGGRGIQERFASAWTRTARAFRDHSNVLGFDPLNEPYAGADYPECGLFQPCSAFESGALTSFYERMIAAIRDAGARHVIWVEGIAQNGQAKPALPAFDDPQTAFSFHYYCSATQLSQDVVPVGAPSPAAEACAPLERAGVGAFLDYADELNVPSLLGEFGCNDIHPDNAQMIDLAGGNFVSWTIWAYYVNVPDPANCPHQGLLIDESKPGSEDNAKQDKLDALVVPYAQAIAGTPLLQAFDRATNTLTLSYLTRPVPGARLARGALTQIFIPARKYPRGYTVSASGARVVSEPSSPWLLLAAERGADQVDVTVTPRSDGTTLLPSETGEIPVPSSSDCRRVPSRGNTLDGSRRIGLRRDCEPR